MLKLGAGKACRRRYERELLRQTDAYTSWIVEEEGKAISGKQITGGPLITVVPYGRPNRWNQTYAAAEYLPEGTDILDFASMKGEFVVYLNGDGALEERILSTFAEKSNYDLIYCDEDCISREGNKRQKPFFKPDASPDTLMSFFYFGNAFAVRRSMALSIATMTGENDFIRLYDFALRYMEKTTKIAHIAEVLYHKYCPDECEKITTGIKISLDSDPEILRIQASAYQRRKASACISKTEEPLISIIILSKDQPEILRLCTESIKIKSKYNRKEVIIIDNGSTQKVKQELEHYAETNGYTYLYRPMDFNYSVLCNIGAEAAQGEYLLFLNDDIEAGDGEFMEKMLHYAALPHVGAVGAKLLYPGSDIIQHVGITNLLCGPSHKLATFSDAEEYYFGRNRWDYDVLAVTGACMMVSREKYFQVGGFSDKMGVSYNDVDLCISLYERGLYNVICNATFLYHHESLSRGTDIVSDAKHERLIRERRLLYSRHEWLQNGDPFYNVNLVQDSLEYRPDVPCDFDRFGYYNPCERMTISETEMRTCEQAQMMIEKTERIRGFEGSAEDYYLIEGWSLHKKRDNALLQRSLLLVPPTGDALKIKVSDRYRADVSEVFPKVRSSALAGFVCRIRCSMLDSRAVYRTAILAESQITSAKYMILGEQYEPTGK